MSRGKCPHPAGRLVVLLTWHIHSERPKIIPVPVEILLIEDNGADVRIIKEIVSHTTVAVRITVAEDGEKPLRYSAILCSSRI